MKRVSMFEHTHSHYFFRKTLLDNLLLKTLKVQKKRNREKSFKDFWSLSILLERNFKQNIDQTKESKAKYSTTSQELY